MKRYLTVAFLFISIVILFFGLRTNYQWNGIVSWGLSLISLILAAYFTKYIPNEKKNEKS